MNLAMYIKFKIHTFSDLLAPLPCLSWKNDTCTISHSQKFLLHMVYSSEILETVQEKRENDNTMEYYAAV